MIINHTTVHNWLADAIWWFKGFKARQPADAEDATEGLGESLRKARIWLRDLGKEDHRLLGLNEREVRIVITEGEFEQIRDLFMPGAGYEETKIARRVVESIADQIRREEHARHRGDPLPF